MGKTNGKKVHYPRMGDRALCGVTIVEAEYLNTHEMQTDFMTAPESECCNSCLSVLRRMGNEHGRRVKVRECSEKEYFDASEGI